MTSMEKVTLVIGIRKGLFLAHRRSDGTASWDLRVCTRTGGR
jgi:hypothetical protein